MTLVLEIIIASVGSVVGIGLLGKVVFYGGQRGFYEVVRRKQKNKLKKKLSKSIDELNYNDFLDCIYTMKNYDNKYYKNQFNKSKSFYKFSDNILENKNNFLRRFDSNYCESEDRIAKLVRYEIEASLSKMVENHFMKNL